MSAIDSEIKEAGKPILPKSWGELETMTVAYGHGIAITPMHVAMTSAAMANGGKLIRPTLLKREPGAVVPFTRVVSEKTSEQMRDLLRRVVTEGTGMKADVPGYPVGGQNRNGGKSGRQGI